MKTVEMKYLMTAWQFLFNVSQTLAAVFETLFRARVIGRARFQTRLLARQLVMRALLVTNKVAYMSAIQQHSAKFNAFHA